MKIWIVLACMLFATNGWTRDLDGQGTNNGGDPIIARAESIELYIQTRLRAELLVFVQAVDPEMLIEEDAAVFQDLIQRGVREDLLRSPYFVASSCLDSLGEERAATAPSGDRSGPICFNAGRLAAENASNGEILGLALHEHAHHFGYADPEHRINRWVESLARVSPFEREQIRRREIVLRLADSLARIASQATGVDDLSLSRRLSLLEFSRLGEDGVLVLENITAQSAGLRERVRRVFARMNTGLISGPAQLQIARAAIREAFGL
mgnify:CR=1 FL=1